MSTYQHQFHIPVMGTGHSIDTPIRVGPFGINSVISIIDDLLLDRIRHRYAEQYALECPPIPRYAEDGRARRITAYLELVQTIVRQKMEAIRQLPFFQKNDKAKYFRLLPDGSPLKKLYNEFLETPEGAERSRLEELLNESMQPGSIDVNIMVKLDHQNISRDGKPLSEEFSDAKAALRGYANSSLESSLVLSAGINQSLFSYMTRFRDFYRDEMGKVRKKIILKVSDFRSAIIQGKLLAKKGLEVHEFRVESGLNCGGHAFPSNGLLLPTLLKEFREKRSQLMEEFRPLIRRFYESMGWKYPEDMPSQPLLTVQGGIGTNGEMKRLQEQFGMDSTGWASPFLLVPEATCVDDETREVLRQAKEEHLYVSDASPLGIQFNNVHGTGSERWTRERAEKGSPGSPCPKGFLVSNTEFTSQPICTASSEYQEMKLAELESAPLDAGERSSRRNLILEKVCLCDHLGNGSLIALGILKPVGHPQAICPGPNIAWFDRLYSLEEMVDHIYGRRDSLTPPERPHMIAKEVVMYVDYFEKLVDRFSGTANERRELTSFESNLRAGMEYCLEIADMDPYPNENLASIRPCVEEQQERLDLLKKRLEKACSDEEIVPLRRVASGG